MIGAGIGLGCLMVITISVLIYTAIAGKKIASVLLLLLVR
jgi:hypothetical protein